MTIFPIIFTAIVARAVRAVAMWKLERGTTLGFLKQLLASRSLVGTLQVQAYSGLHWAMGLRRSMGLHQRSTHFNSSLGYAHSIFYCHISTAYVEAAVNCTAHSCAVTRMRSLQRRHRNRRLVPFEFTKDSENFFRELSMATKPSKSGNSRAPQLTEFFLNDPLLPLANTYSLDKGLYKIPLRDISIRLGQVINTYYLSSLNWDAITGMGSGGMSTMPISGGGNVVVYGWFYNTTTKSTTSVNHVRFVCRWRSWTVFVSASLVMLTVACEGAFNRMRTTGPDILGYVSSLTRDSPYVMEDIARGGSVLDGLDRARLLKDLRVQMRNVKPHRDVGYLAFSLAQEDDNKGLRGLVKIGGRVYK